MTRYRSDTVMVVLAISIEENMYPNQMALVISIIMDGLQGLLERRFYIERKGYHYLGIVRDEYIRNTFSRDTPKYVTFSAASLLKQLLVQ